MIAHERLGAVEGVRKYLGVMRITHIPEHHRRIALESAQFRPLGDVLNATLNSSCLIARTARDSPRIIRNENSRGANSGSSKSRAKLTFHGHTSWEMSRYTIVRSRCEPGS